MNAVRALPYNVLEERLRIYGCRLIRRLAEGAELWETGWGEPFVLSPEPDGLYDEWQYFQLLAGVIAKTMPPDWNSGGGNNNRH
jgi:hypothetical protein